jgi:hypothetical protein
MTWEERAKCPKCHFEIRKDGNCFCTDTGTLEFIMDFHDKYYDHGLGQVINSKQERRRVMKEKGLFEIGNERNEVDPIQQDKRRDKEYNNKLKEIGERALKELHR